MRYSQRKEKKNKKQKKHSAATDFWKNCVRWVKWLPEVRLDRNVKGWRFFFFFFLLATKKTKKIKRWHDVTAAVRGCISLLDPCQVPLKCLLPSAPPSFSPIKKENVSGVRGRVWEVPLVALDTEYCLQSRDGLPSTVSKRSRPPSVQVLVQTLPRPPARWRGFLKKHQI